MARARSRLLKSEYDPGVPPVRKVDGADRTAAAPAPQERVSQELPTFEELADGNTLLGRIDEINAFSFIVSYQKSGALTHEAVVDQVLAALLRNLSDVLVTSGIHYLHAVKATSQHPAQVGARLDESKVMVAVSLEHSVYHFAVRVFDDRFVITREPSSLRDFYEWYRLFMPNATQLEATVRQSVARVHGQPLEITQTLCEFKFIFSDFRKLHRREQRQPRNVDVLSAIIPTVPNPSGPTELSKQDFARLDLTLSRLEQFESGSGAKWRNCWYLLEAPSNERSRFIVFTAQLRNAASESSGESTRSGHSPVIPFDLDFSDEHAMAIVDFLKARALDDFMGTLLEDWSFSTQRRL